MYAARDEQTRRIEVQVLLRVGRDLPGVAAQHGHVRENREQGIAERGTTATWCREPVVASEGSALDPRSDVCCSGGLFHRAGCAAHDRRRLIASLASTSSVPRAVAPHVKRVA